MNEFKTAFIPGLLAYTGVRAAAAFAPASTMWQVGLGVLGAMAGIVIAKKL